MSTQPRPRRLAPRHIPRHAHGRAALIVATLLRNVLIDGLEEPDTHRAVAEIEDRMRKRARKLLRGTEDA